MGNERLKGDVFVQPRQRAVHDAQARFGREIL